MRKELQAGLPVLGLLAKAPADRDIFVFVGTAKKLVHLPADLVGIEALLNHIRRKFQLREPHEIFCDDSEDHVVLLRVVELEHVLHEVVAEWILDQR